MLCPNAVSPAEQPRKRRSPFVRELDELHGPDARLVGRADVRVVLAEIPRDRLDDLVGALRAARDRRRRQDAGRARRSALGLMRCRVRWCSRDLLTVDDPAMRGLGHEESSRRSSHARLGRRAPRVLRLAERVRGPPPASPGCRRRRRGRRPHASSRHACALPAPVESSPACRAVCSMLASEQRTSPASTRCSDHHSAWHGSGLPPSALRASPARSTVTSNSSTRGRVGIRPA